MDTNLKNALFVIPFVRGNTTLGGSETKLFLEDTYINGSSTISDPVLKKKFLKTDTYYNVNSF